MPYKLSIWIVLFLVAFNGGHVMLDASGTYDYLGVSADPGTPSEVTQAANQVDNYDTGTGGGSTLFGLYNTLADPLEAVFNAILPGAAMLKNVGVPTYLVNFTFAPLALIPGIDLIKFLRGA